MSCPIIVTVIQCTLLVIWVLYLLCVNKGTLSELKRLTSLDLTRENPILEYRYGFQFLISFFCIAKTTITKFLNQHWFIYSSESKSIQNKRGDEPSSTLDQRQWKHFDHFPLLFLQTAVFTSVCQDQYSHFSLQPFQHPAHSPSPQPSSCNNPLPYVHECTQNDITTSLCSWTSFCKKLFVYNYKFSVSKLKLKGGLQCSRVK